MTSATVREGVDVTTVYVADAPAVVEYIVAPASEQRHLEVDHVPALTSGRLPVAHPPWLPPFSCHTLIRCVAARFDEAVFPRLSFATTR